MMHLFLNSLAASAGGGLTYVRNVIPHLAARSEVRTTVALAPSLRKEFGDLESIDFLELKLPLGRRFLYEQSQLPKLIQRSGADVLLSAGNFALRKSPVPQILLSRNSIYTSVDFSRDLLARHEYRLWLDTQVRSVIAKRSIRWADVTVAPSEAFAEELRRWTGAPARVIHHGFDHEAFTRNSTPLASDVEEKLRAIESSFKILFVSHYNYYRNFETLLRALPILRDRLPGRSVKLLLTCELTTGKSPGGYRTDQAARLIRDLQVADMIVELGTIPYRHLHHIYERADLYVSPAYTETFAHPLVEAMASALPVIASDIAVHREICRDAGAYFQRFSPAELVDNVVRVATSPETAKHMVEAGKKRAQSFSWKTHVERILDVARSLVQSQGS